MKIAVAGTGYVGLSNAIILAQHHHVIAVDVIEDMVAKGNHNYVIRSNSKNSNKSKLVKSMYLDMLYIARRKIRVLNN